MSHVLLWTNGRLKQTKNGPGGLEGLAHKGPGHKAPAHEGLAHKGPAHEGLADEGPAPKGHARKGTGGLTRAWPIRARPIPARGAHEGPAHEGAAHVLLIPLGRHASRCVLNGATRCVERGASIGARPGRRNVIASRDEVTGGAPGLISGTQSIG